MLSTGHAIIGIYLVQTTPNPYVGGALALMSHYLFDLIPHGDEGLGLWIKDNPKRVLLVELADWLALGLMVWYLFSRLDGISWITIVIGVVASTLPDFLSEIDMESRDSRAPFHRLSNYLTQVKPLKYLLRWHHRVHHFIHYYLGRVIRWPIGVAWQIAITGFFLWLLILK